MALIQPNTHIILRLPTGLQRCVEMKPNTIVEVGKLGSFPSNLLLGRPYWYTYELLEKREKEAYSRLRIVKPDELNKEIVDEEATPVESRVGTPGGNGVVEEQIKTNQMTIDDATRQQLSQAEIEELKKSAGGKEIIDKILANHAGLDEKTVFSRAKYMLRKRSKYLKRFTVLPIDIGNLIDYVLDKEPSRIMDMRLETLGLITAWSNAHVVDADQPDQDAVGRRLGGGRLLVADETGGLVVAALAECLGILHKPGEQPIPGKNDMAVDADGDISLNAEQSIEGNGSHHKATLERSHRDFPIPAPTNSITLLHAAVQPNISLLKYFGYDANTPDPDHPLHTHLKPLSYLQLLEPTSDPTYKEPEFVPETELAQWKSGKRGTYWRKRRRWERCKSVVDETREGGFEALIIASNMDPISILPHTIPLIRGGGHIVIYSPTVEPLVQIMDLFSKDRRAAYIQHAARGTDVTTPELRQDFPVDPRLLLAPTLQTSRAREWQVLPGRTHPLMTSRGGSEGYVFTARRVVPLEGSVEARGNYAALKKRRKVELEAEVGAGDERVEVEGSAAGGTAG
ncbi:tRNA (adenine(58)-N(1))-methyltransferase non-catalytic subunit trm6-like [Teratosphaeria destructans]|uniref:tRNA (adenine(58)-N(1))-methyltransferase non-catalytic subunit TRM6 n=1 Tax=Teratosphaeria destructans TaxID=418781 RepID=A0A9W7W250_9PEZI|nr:tRNA (adenine(58)-N(1))-methyltransferase non-catalytic subunit trm6-like [Teratosphaeria destructans]